METKKVILSRTHAYSESTLPYFQDWPLGLVVSSTRENTLRSVILLHTEVYEVGVCIKLHTCLLLKLFCTKNTEFHSSQLINLSV